MKVIKEGDPDRLKETKRFHCAVCGCIFEADKGEYYTVEQQIDVTYACLCPFCGEEAFYTKPMEHGLQGR